MDKELWRDQKWRQQGREMHLLKLSGSKGQSEKWEVLFLSKDQSTCLTCALSFTLFCQAVDGETKMDHVLPFFNSSIINYGGARCW